MYVGNVVMFVFPDIADVSIKQCEQRYRDLQRNRHSRRYPEPLFDMQFITADCTKVWPTKMSSLMFNGNLSLIRNTK